MAEMCPDALPRRATKGEEKTYAALKNLPDDYKVYYEPVIDDRRPDFIVIAPDLGVLVIEVKGWRIDDIAGGNDSEVILFHDGMQRREQHPIEQARGYMWRLVNSCKKHPYLGTLLNKDGRFIFPFGYLAILPYITSEQLKKDPERDFSTIFHESRTITRDTLQKWEMMSSEDLREQIKKYISPQFPFQPLNDDQMKILRLIIHPHIGIQLPIDIVYQNNESIDEKAVLNKFSRDLKVLDFKQEKNACRIGEGHRIIYGVAGSGKTILLISRGKLLHEIDEDFKILILCYNVTLGAYLRNMLKEYPRIQVSHFDGWAKKNGIKREFFKDSGKGESDESLGLRLLEQLKMGVGDSHYYDAILLDEAQDFDPVWFKCVKEAMKEPEDGDLLIVCDGNQGIHSTKGISWKSVGIHAVGRTTHSLLDLDKNYRNTEQILKIAANFSSKNTKNNEDGFGIVPIDPAKAVRKDGIPPIILKCQNHKEECDKAIEIVKILLGNGKKSDSYVHNLKPEEIGILYPRLQYHEKELLLEFKKKLGQIAPTIWINEDYTTKYKILEPGIKLQTVHSAKGLQYRAVILIWSDLFMFKNLENVDQQRNLFYVALTRPEDFLAITYSETNELLEQILHSDDITVLNNS
jgi:hypothetical protein